MRHLMPGARRAERGLTLIELMVGLAIAAILVLAASPSFVDYIQNSRLRENGNVVYTQALLAQSEAIKRNNTVRLSTNGATVRVIDLRDPANPAVLYERTLTNGITATNTTVDFVGVGRTAGLVTAAIDLGSSTVTCSSDYRCPGLRIEAGGAIRLCNDHTAATC